MGRPQSKPAALMATNSADHLLQQQTLRVRQMNSPAIGEDFRVHMLCDGMETIARYYSKSGRVKIVKGTLRGAEFSDPHAAAAAVMERDTPGHSGKPDGWKVWRLKGGPDLPLGSVRKTR